MAGIGRQTFDLQLFVGADRRGKGNSRIYFTARFHSYIKYDSTNVQMLIERPWLINTKKMLYFGLYSFGYFRVPSTRFIVNGAKLRAPSIIARRHERLT